MTISESIKELRTMHHMTQAEFGKIAGVSDKAVSTWENGTAEPRLDAQQENLLQKARSELDQTKKLLTMLKAATNEKSGSFFG